MSGLVPLAHPITQSIPNIQTLLTAQNKKNKKPFKLQYSKFLNNKT